MSLLADLEITGGRYRYLTTMSRLMGPNNNLQRVDASKGVLLEQESAANSNGDEVIDYRDAITVNGIGTGKYDLDGNLLYINGHKLDIKYPVGEDGKPKGHMWTHFSIYRTLNLLDELTDQTIASETFVFNADTPVGKSIIAYKLNASSGRLILASDSPNFVPGDKGAIVTFIDGTQARIQEVLDDKVATVFDASTNTPFTDDIINPEGVYGHIGHGTQFVFNRVQVDSNTAEYMIHEQTSGTDVVDESIIGRQLIFAFNETAIVKYIRKDGGDTYLGVFERDGVPYNGDFSHHTAIYNCTSRVWTDFTFDDVLQTRLNSGEPLYLMQTRFFKPLPNGKLGAVAGGAYFTCPYKSSEYYYSQIANLYRTGYYDSDNQRNDKPVGSITRLKEYPNSLVIWGKNFTWYLDPSLVDNVGEVSIGEFIPRFPDPRLITDKIGLVTESNAVKVDSGGELIYTSEPAVRFFDGFKYSENIADDRVQTSKIARFFPAVIMAWSKRRGLKLWGVFAK